MEERIITRKEALEMAVDVVNHGVHLMDVRQLSKWNGVRMFLELAESLIAEEEAEECSTA